MVSPIQQFTRDVLSHQGALVDTDDTGLDIVAGPDLAARLGLADYQRLVFTPDAGASGAVLVDYDSPLVEKVGRLLDVADRYRVRVRLAPLAVLACHVPTYQMTVRLHRRNAAADAIFSWNPIDRRVETRGCDGCHAPVDAALLCDDRVHYLCGRCLAPCAQCGKPYCRACHTRCPRRHDA